VKIFGLSRRYNPARRAFVFRTLVVQSVLLLVIQVSNVVKGAIAIVVHIIRRQQDIQERRTVGARHKLVQVPFKGIQDGALGCLQVIHVILERQSLRSVRGRPRLRRVIVPRQPRTVAGSAGQIETQTLDVTVNNFGKDTHSGMIVQWDFGVGRKDKDPHTVLIRDFGKMNVAYRVGVGRRDFIMNGTYLHTVERRKPKSKRLRIELSLNKYPQ